jgi:hypothetical protein
MILHEENVCRVQQVTLSMARSKTKEIVAALRESLSNCHSGAYITPSAAVLGCKNACITPIFRLDFINDDVRMFRLFARTRTSVSVISATICAFCAAVTPSLVMRRLM